MEEMKAVWREKLHRAVTWHYLYVLHFEKHFFYNLPTIFFKKPINEINFNFTPLCQRVPKVAVSEQVKNKSFSMS